MFSISCASMQDKQFWFSLDKHISEAEFELKLHEKRCYIISDGKPIGIMRYNLFWDRIPFLTMIYFDEPNRRKGYGTKALLHWENEMRQLGHKIVMTSTQANEEAQFFYRKLAYKDKGSLVIDIPPFEQPPEIFLMKEL